jgi:uncharacterized damage-inducible protein DinB
MNPATIDQYERQADILTRWTAGLTDADLDAFPVPGTWSIRQLVTHMLDSDHVATHRMRRIAAEDLPLLVSYDETRFSQLPATMAGGVKLAADLFALNRRWTAAFLRALPAEAFARVGIHTQRGKVTIADFVPLYVGHITHHEPFLVAKRKALGKPLN